MRWFFLILLLVNLALFAWFQQELNMRDRLSSRTELVGVDVKPIKLLSEIPVQLRQRQSTRADVATEVTKEVPGLACYQIGDFSSELAAVRFQQSKLPGSVVSSVKSVERNSPDYWVYVKSPKDLQQRQALQKQLRNSGLEVSLIKRGELKGELSLGRYSSRELAQALLSALLEQKHPAEVFEISYESSVFVLEIVDNAVKEIGNNWLSDLLAVNSALKSEKKMCKGVASTEDPE